MNDVVIVGGGVIGLSIAHALADEGIAASVLDRGPLGRQASWAGAGIISPPAERPVARPLASLRTLSARLQPEWSEALRAATGIDNGYRRTGGVDLALTEAEDHHLRADAGRWRAEGIAFERLEPRDFPRVEPALGPEVRVAYYLPDLAQIRNPHHLRALIAANQRRGVRLEPERAALGFDIQGDRIVAVRTSGGPLPCGLVIVAAGAWSSHLLEGIGLRVATPPVKGQIVLLRDDRPIIGRIIEHGKRYLVPRVDGRVLVGSTEEDAGFDTRSTPTAVRDLIDEALRLCPALAEAEVERTWAGLRPGGMDARPYLGMAPGYANLIVATGHQRSGLQLSTGTAVLIADLVAGRQPRIDLGPFRLDREPEMDEDAFRS